MIDSNNISVLIVMIWRRWTTILQYATHPF